jgi:hypothetical protein
MLVKANEIHKDRSMLKKTLLLLMVGILSNSISLSAEDAPNTSKAVDTPGLENFWLANFGGDSTYLVQLGRIVSVSRHKYLLDANLVVDEVTVDTTGQALARFYFIRPVSEIAPENAVTSAINHPKELLDSTAKKLGVDVQDMVMKKYPETSHAKALEYRLKSESDLKSLCASVTKAWVSGRGCQFTLK